MEKEMLNGEAVGTATETGECVVREGSCILPEINARICYVLSERSGASRAEFGTPCHLVYNLTVRRVDAQGEEVCHLPDVARQKEEALALFDRFVEAGVTPVGAPDVMEEMLAVLPR